MSAELQGLVATLHEGPIYRVQRRTLPDGRTHVVKRLVRELPDPPDVAALLAEHALLVELADVPGLVRAVGLEREAGLPLLVLEDAGPRSLAERDEGERWPADRVVAVGAALAHTLACVHEHGVVHRDVNPMNVVLADDGQPVLIDLGLATRFVGPRRPVELTEQLVGTVAYIAPELTGRTGLSVDHRADLYGLGVTLFELAAGRRPFDADAPGDMVRAHLATPAPRLEDVPDDLAGLVGDLLAKDPGARPVDAWVVVERLAALADTLGVSLADRVAVPSTRRARRLPPTRLLGRDEDLAHIDDALSAAAAGDGRLLLVEGPPGIGRTALVQVARDLARTRGGLVGTAACGTRGPRSRSNALSRALEDAWRMLGVAEPGRVGPLHDRIRERCVGLELEAAVLVPALADWLPPPPARELQPGRTRVLLEAALVALVDALAPVEHPLLLVLDDIHRSDAETLARLRHLAAHLGHLPAVVIATISSTADGDRIVDRLRRGRSSAAVDVLSLSPLPAAALVTLCDDILGAPVDTPDALERLVMRQSGGRPRRVVQLLRTLEREAVLQARPRSWTLDLDALEHIEPELSGRWQHERELASLPDHSRRALRMLAVAGPAATLSDLAALMGGSLRDTATDFAEPLRRGLVLASTDAWRTALPPDIDEEELEALGLGLSFSSEPLRAAALAEVDEAEQRRAHRFLAGRLVDRAESDIDALFACVSHLRAAGDEVAAGQDRVDAAQLAARAVRAALAQGAGEAAWAQAQAGLSWAEAEPEVPRQLLHALRVDGAQAAWMSGDHDAAQALLDRTGACCLEDGDRLAIDTLRVQLLTMAGQLADALSHGRQALARLGVVLPGGDDSALLERLEEDFHGALRASEPLDLAALPLLPPGPERATLNLLQELIPAAFFSAPAVFVALVHHISTRSLTRGLSGASGYALTFEGALLVQRGELERGHALARLGVERASAWRSDAAAPGADAAATPRFACEALFTYAHHVQHWFGDLDDNLQILDEALESAIAAGDTAWRGFVRVGKLMNRWPLVSDLAAFETDVDDTLDFLSRTGNQPVVDLLLPHRQLCRWLRGTTHDGLDDADFAEASWSGGLNDNSTVRAVQSVLKLQGAVIFDRVELVASLVADTAAVGALLQGSFIEAERVFYRGLGAAIGGDVDALKSAIDVMATHASRVASSFSHKKRLLQAELCWLEGDNWAALEAYDEAAVQARQAGFLVDAALSLQRAAHRLDGGGRRVAARAYADRARQVWLLIGAKGPAAALADRWSASGGVAGSSASATSGSSSTHSATLAADGSGTTAENIDLQALMGASEALSAELETGTLVEKVLEAARNLGGARRVTLVLAGPMGMLVEASLDDEGHRALGEPLIESQRVCHGLIAEARGRRQPVAVGDALADRGLRHDPWVQRNRARSLLVVPAQRQQRLVAMLFLENDLVPHAFTHRRVRALSLLATQVAIALENARLFDRVRAETADRLETERKLLQAQRLETVGRLAAGVAHDFNNLLAVIMGWAEHVQACLPEDSTLSNPLDQVVTTAEKGSTLTRQLLAFSRQSVASPRPTDVAQTLSGIGKLVNRLLGSGVDLQLLAGPALPRVLIDPGLLEQVLINLLLNARDAMPRGGMIQVGCREEQDPPGLAPGRYVAVEVVDEGTGMDAATVDKIFEPFFTTKGNQGTGLGLSTCLGIAEQSGGTIRVHSTPGQGSCFTLLLPVSELEAEADAPADAPAARGQGRVLVVEDEASVREMIEVSLQTAGMEVHAAADGRAALTALDEGFVPQVLLTDLSMPGMSGIDVILSARERLPGLPAVLLSGLARGNITEALPGDVVYRQKPVRMRDLLALLAALRDGDSPPANK